MVLQQTLSIILCQCLSRIILWYCSKLNTILTSKFFHAKNFLYWYFTFPRGRNQCICPLHIFITILNHKLSLPKTTLLLDNACQLNKICFSFYKLLLVNSKVDCFMIIPNSLSPVIITMSIYY